MVKINPPMQVDELLVAYNNYELFIRGFYYIKENDNDTLNDVIIPRVVFNQHNSNNWIDAESWGNKLLCGYGGTGPGNLIRFILKHGKYKEDDLEDKIHHNNVVIYNFNKNNLEAFNTQLTRTNYKIDIKAKKDGKLVFLPINNNSYSKEEILNSIEDALIFIETTTDNNFQLNTIKYIGDKTSEEYNYYTSGYSNQPHYNIILEYNKFEIWLNYPFSLEQKDIKYDTDFKKILQKINVKLLDKKYDNPILKMIDKLTKNEDQINVTIPIYNN